MRGVVIDGEEWHDNGVEAPSFGDWRQLDLIVHMWGVDYGSPWPMSWASPRLAGDVIEGRVYNEG